LKELSSLGTCTSRIRSGVLVTTSEEELQDELLVFPAEFRAKAIALLEGVNSRGEKEK
jgi:hypothetical protein